MAKRPVLKSFVGGIAYDSHKKNWSVAEILTKDRRMTGVVHHPGPSARMCSSCTRRCSRSCRWEGPRHHEVAG